VNIKKYCGLTVSIVFLFTHMQVKPMDYYMHDRMSVVSIVFVGILFVCCGGCFWKKLRESKPKELKENNGDKPVVTSPEQAYVDAMTGASEKIHSDDDDDSIVTKIVDLTGKEIDKIVLRGVGNLLLRY
jgi:hypothetical protein